MVGWFLIIHIDDLILNVPCEQLRMYSTHHTDDMM